jgi:hypothetical protein
MDKITAVLINWQAFLISFAAFAIIGVVRGIGTRKDSSGVIVGGWAQSRVFKMLLPILPYVITLGIVFLPDAPLPEQVQDTLTVKVLYGVWAGWLSDKSFQIVKRVLEKGFNMKFGADK